jgi:hypothetical protein
MIHTEAPPVIQEFVVEIGHKPVLLRTQNVALQEILQQRYAGFICKAARSEHVFDVDVVAAEDPVSDIADARVWYDNGVWRMERGDFRAEWNARAGTGRILQCLTPYAIDSVLRIVHTLILAQQGGFLLHAASAIRNGRAFLFSGVSGAGKTTIATLAPADALLLTDEISYIRRDADEYVACGTPFAGELAKPGENAAAPIQRLYFLAKGPENRIDPINSAEALRLLLRNILFFADDPELVKMVFRSANEFLGKVPAFRLTFYPDARVWDLIG